VIVCVIENPRLFDDSVLVVVVFADRVMVPTNLEALLCLANVTEIQRRHLSKFRLGRFPFC